MERSEIRVRRYLSGSGRRDAASSLSLRILTTLSSSYLPTCEIPLRADDENFRRLFDPADHRSLGRCLAAPVGRRQEQWVDLPAQFIFRVMGGCIEVRIV